jgi:hypothetical protein
MASTGDDSAVVLNLSDRELVHQAYLNLIEIEGQGVDPNAGVRRYYQYRAWYLRKWAADVLRKHKKELYQKICVEFDYCARVKRQGKNADLLLGLLDATVAILGGISLALLAWMLKKNILDRLCRCQAS